MGDEKAVIGRDDELAEVVHWLESGRSGLVVGPAGIGKSTLVDAAAAVAGVGTVSIRGLRHMLEVPLLPIRLARPTIDPDATVDDVRTELLEHLTDRRLLVDDLQFCDRDTLAVVAELAMRTPVIATLRPGDGAWDDARRALVATGGLVALRPLVPDAARTIVRGLRPGAPESDVERWVDAAAGSPYELRLHALGRSDAVVDDATAVAALPDRLRVALAETAAGAPAQLPEALAHELVAIGVIRVDADGRAWPAHDRLGEAALAALDEATRVEIHRRLAAAAVDPAVRAVHLAEAGDHDGAARAARAAQRHAPSRWSYASFLRLEARHTRPPDPAVAVDAAEALSLVARYEDALDCLAGVQIPASLETRAALVTARAAWALTDIPAAHAAIEQVLGRPDADTGARAEMLTIRSRIRSRVDWDLDGAIRDGIDALELAGSDTRLRAAAYSALGLARLIVADPAWAEDLETAARLAVDDVDVHEAVTINDTAIFGHLLNGDPARSRALAQEMVAFTEPVSAAWNGYFRAVALMVTMHVTGDHAAVRPEAEMLGHRPLSVRAGETRRTALILALLDGGDELAALDLAETSLALATDESARAMASWMLAESAWLVGDAERALEVARSTLALPTAGYPACVNAAITGLWAARDLGRPSPPELVDATASGFANLAAAQHEAAALASDDPAAAAAEFATAATAWTRISVRAARRCRWAEAGALVDVGAVEDARRAFSRLQATTAEARSPWFDRRVAALARRAGIRVDAPSAGTSGAAVMARVLRGHPTPVIARGLCLGRATVEGHVRDAVTRTGARTRLEAALMIAAEHRTPDAPRTYSLCGTGVGAWAVTTAELDGRERRDRLPRVPLYFDGDLVFTATVDDPDGVELVLLAAARGAGLEVRVTDASALAALVDGLGRLGRVVREPAVRAADGPPPVELDDIDRALIVALASGSTVMEAATAVSYSRRQVQRRLEELRARTGCATNAEVVATLAPFVPN